MKTPFNIALAALALASVRYTRATGFAMNGAFGPIPWDIKTVGGGTDDWPAAPGSGLVAVPRAGFYLCRATFRHTNGNTACNLVMGSKTFTLEQGTNTGPFVQYGNIGFAYLNAGDNISITGSSGGASGDNSPPYLDIMRLS